MPQTRDIALEELAASGDALSVPGTRVDAAHTLGDTLAAPPLAEMPVDQAIHDLVRVEGAVQLQSQADQLAAHLRQRQQDLDRREAQLNARLADFEQEVRDARLWLAQRNDELNEREEGFRFLHPEGTRGSGFRTDGTSVGNGVPSGPRGVPRLSEAEWEEQRQRLARQSEELDRRRTALEEFRAEVSQRQREALELRLGAEEVQAQLRAALGLKAADNVLAAARERLAGYFRDEADELTRRRDELEWLKNDLAAEYARLERRHEEFATNAGEPSIDQERND